MTQQEVTQWEIENFNYVRAESDYTIKEGYKVITYFFKDKSYVTFEIKQETHGK